MSVSTRLSDNGEITAWVIDEYDPDKACVMLEKLIGTGVIIPALYNYATLRYDTSKTLEKDPQSDDHYPLRFFSKSGAPIVLVSQVTAGYDGTGPCCAKKCIDKMGFKISKEQEQIIYSQPCKTLGTIINLAFYKRSD